MKIGALNNLSSYTRVNQKAFGLQENDSKDKGVDDNTQATKKLDTNEMAMVQKLQARDTEVRAHEAAHQAAGGGLAGGATFTYQRGPDGKMYAIGGEVPISIKSGSTPREKIAIARQIQAAALAPAHPSSQDFAVASKAKMMEMQAQVELYKIQSQLGSKDNSDTKKDKQNSLISIDTTA